jgi:sulfate transporter 3
MSLWFCRILRWAREEENRIKENNGTTLKCIILDMTAVSAIDTSGLEAVFELRRRLEKQSLQLVLVNPVGTVMEKLHKSKIIEALGLSGLYLTVGEAVADLSSTWKANGQP